MPLGSLVSGYFASKFGAPIVLVCNGILLTGVATYFMVGATACASYRLGAPGQNVVLTSSNPALRKNREERATHTVVRLRKIKTKQ